MKKQHVILNIKMRFYIYKYRHVCNENSFWFFWLNIDWCFISILSASYISLWSIDVVFYNKVITQHNMNLKWKYKKQKCNIFNCFMSHCWVVRSFCFMKWPSRKIQPWTIGRVKNKIHRKLTLNWVDHRTDVHDKNVLFISLQQKINQ